MRHKAKALGLRRPRRFMLRFNESEIREFFSSAKKSGLSKVEYGRRKILGLPIADITGRKPVPEAQRA